MSASSPLWEEASQSVIHVAEELIRKYHPHLKMARIGFIFRSEAQSQGGKQIFGQAKKVSEREQVYLDFDFVIWVSKASWERESSAWCEALLDHELCHCGIGENGWRIRQHDVQEFTDIIERHGWWNDDLLSMSQAKTRQLAMELGEELHRMGAVLSVSPAAMEHVESTQP